MMTIYSAAVTLILVMDPLGNIPMFISVLSPVEPARQWWIVLRESLIAFITLSLFLFFGHTILSGLGISEPALSIAGGIILFLIALRMIFPSPVEHMERYTEEPFIVPLAIPFVAGPSAIATVLLFVTQEPNRVFDWFLALVIASSIATTILLTSSWLRKLLGKKGLLAVERLMGMILITLSIQMFLNGINDFFKLH